MTYGWIGVLALSMAALSSSARAWEPAAGPKERAPRWSGPMIYRLNQAGSDDLDLAALAAEVHKAMLEWTTPDCTGASARYDGLTSELPPIKAGMPGADNVIAWRESGWLDGPQVVAVTAPSFIATNSGAQVIVAATMRLNGQDWTWVKGTSSGRQMNLFSVLLHEGGHYWGLGHTSVPMSVMVVNYSTDLTGLAPDDRDGICSLYPLGASKECTPSTCPSGYSCANGNCLWEGTGVPPVCMVDRDCAGTEHCEAGLCVTDMSGCVVDRDCASREERCVGGGCMVVVDPASSMCTSNSDCAADEVCKAGLCLRPDPAQRLPVGSDCMMDGDCESGLCRFAVGMTHCTAFCTSDADCGKVERCLRDGTQTGLCGPGAHVSEPGSHRAAQTPSTGCSTSPARSSSTTAWGWLIATAWLLRARTRRVPRG